jgi:hypothetical protein
MKFLCQFRRILSSFLMNQARRGHQSRGYLEKKYRSGISETVFTIIVALYFYRHTSVFLNEPPNIRDNKKSTRKIKNKILAIEAAPAAMPPKPKIAAIIATTRKTTVQRNIA